MKIREKSFVCQFLPVEDIDEYIPGHLVIWKGFMLS